MQAITKVFSDIVKPYIDATDNGLINNDFTNGAVNLFPVTATTQTVNGITFTVNSDGTITANGTSTTDFSFSLYGTAGNRLFDTGVLQKGKSYKISGTPSGMPTTVYMYLNTSDGATRDNGDGAIINSTSSYLLKLDFDAIATQQQAAQLIQEENNQEKVIEILSSASRNM